MSGIKGESNCRDAVQAPVEGTGMYRTEAPELFKKHQSYGCCTDA